MPNALVLAYLKGEALSPEESKRRRAKCAWFGTSLMAGSNHVIKELCAASDDGTKKTMWDPERKLWGTTRLENVVALVASGLWAPSGIPVSMKDEVALEAKRIVDCEKQAARDSEDAKKQAATEARERAAMEAAQKQAELVERERRGREFDDADVEYAWKHYGLSREILLASPSFTWLGPRPSDPMIRIRRWFNFPHNRERGAAAVVAEDFEPAYREVLNKRQGQTAPRVAPKRARTVGGVETMEDVRKREMARVQQIRERQREAETDAHAVALAFIIEKARKLPPLLAPYARNCPHCGVKPTEQFLECSCRDDVSQNWTLCSTCNSIWHPDKLACLCAAK